MAETTTTTSWPAFWAAMQRRATFLMRSTSPTEVPPYFWTMSAKVLGPLPACRADLYAERNPLSKGHTVF